MISFNRDRTEMLFQGKRILVTGGTGFIGSHLVPRILDEGGEVSVLTRQEKSSKEVNFIRGDIAAPDVSEKITKNIDVIFHLAGYADVSGAIKNPAIAFEANAAGTFYLLDSARKNGVGRFVYISSVRVYGDPQYTPQDETHPLKPKEFYGASKLIGELYCTVFNGNYGLSTVIVRPFSVYGPGELPKAGSLSGVVSIFVRNAFEGQEILITGDGSQTKDFVYISDVIDGLILVATNDECIGDVFNLGYGKGVSINRLAELVIENTKANASIRHIPQVQENVSNSADISKAKSILNYSPKVPIEEGVQKYIAWYRKETNIK